MHEIEPYYNWKPFYSAEFDKLSPFFRRKYSELYFENSVYNYAIHPQWDEIGSPTLYIKILFADYEQEFAIIELLGEWNDAISNDVMFLKREVIDVLLSNGITKFILIGENVLNFHFSEDDYYEEWYQDVEDGWIVAINFREHILQDFSQHNLDYYLLFGGVFDNLNWRIYSPEKLFEYIQTHISKRLN